MINRKLCIYDEEVYSNIFTMGVYLPHLKSKKVYELSPRKNNWPDLYKLLMSMQKNNVLMVGFNNLGFDYPIIHMLLTKYNTETIPEVIISEAKIMCDAIIACKTPQQRFKHMVYPNNRIIDQLDLYKVWHFDNQAKATSLKLLEFNMGADDIQDLPFDPALPVAEEDMDELKTYNMHDVMQTWEFFLRSQDALKFREKLSRGSDKDFLNFSDSKIGVDYFTTALQEKGVQLYDYHPDTGREARQTHRDKVALDDIIFDYIEFDHPSLNALFDWLVNYTVRGTKEVFTELPMDEMTSLDGHSNLSTVKKKQGKDENGKTIWHHKVRTLNVIVDDLQYTIGTGGLHASVENQTYYSNDDKMILDLDVTSYYPSLIIMNNIYPEHLGPAFVKVYMALKADRLTYKKGDSEYALIKLALNSVFGNMNNPHSVFKDQQALLSVTVNGQLLLLKLVDEVVKLEGMQVLQANTDGITLRFNRSDYDKVKEITQEWEWLTGLDLEEVEYDAMFLRDVNNYMARTVDSKLKYKGKFEHDFEEGGLWHKDFGNRASVKAAIEYLVDGVSIEDTIRANENLKDFHLRVKLNRGSKLVSFSDGDLEPTEHQRITRYYVSDDGESFYKVMPPLKTTKEKENPLGELSRDRYFAIQKGYLLTPQNTMQDWTIPYNINYEWYTDKAQQIVDDVLSNGVFE